MKELCLIIESSAITIGKRGFTKVTPYLTVPADELHEFEVLGTESRLTVTRLATLGLAGAGLKRNRTIVRFATPDGRGATVETRVDERTTLGLVRHFPWVRALLDTPRTPTGQIALPTETRDIAAQLSDLAALKEAGALTDEEFQNAKARLLG